MKTRFFLATRGPLLGCLAFMATLALSACSSQPAGSNSSPLPTNLPPVAKNDINAPVTLTDNGNNWVLDNGIVKVTVNKQSGNFRSLMYHGKETMSAGGAWEETPQAASQVGGLTQKVTIDPKSNGGERAEVAVKGITGGKVGLSPGSPGAPATGTFNMDMEIRVAMGRGQSGIYTYAVFAHPAAYGPLSVPESRFITFISRDYDWLSVDADRNMLECAPTDWGTGVVVHAKEQRIMSKGVYKNSVEHKYTYNAIQYKIPAYGWSSTKNHVGIWFINPSIEYLSGGATKQELVCHYGDNANPTPIILDYWRGTHYGGGASANIKAGEEWNKVIGPIFVYCNTLENAHEPTQADLDTLKATEGNPTVPAAWKENGTALWQDALAQAKKEKSQWPYNWVNGVDYPHKEERGSVSGRIVLNDPQAPTKKLPHLTVGLAHPTYVRNTGAIVGTPEAAGAPAAIPENMNRGGTIIDWAHDAKFYEFWNDGSDDGKFTITNARPGSYTLTAFADGVLGELTIPNVPVKAGENINLGNLEWKPIRNGKQIWEIGYVNRNSSEFFKGDPGNYWLWGWPLRYPLLFPNDLTYTIGKSTPSKDWFFEQVAHGLSTAWLNPDAKDPANQKFGWVKAESTEKYPQTDQSGPWRTYGRGRATTWTIKFNMDKDSKGQAALRVALAGADGGGLTVAVNGTKVGTIMPAGTNALRYNTDKGIWNEYTQKFDGSLMKAGENKIELTVPAGEVTSGVVYDYLRLELDENARPAGQVAVVK